MPTCCIITATATTTTTIIIINWISAGTRRVLSFNGTLEAQLNYSPRATCCL